MIETMYFQKPPVTRERIDQAARDLGCSFPDDYTQFLLKYNGGAPEPEDFPLSKTSGSLVGGFLSVTDGGEDDEVMDLVVNNRLKRGRIPEGFIVIGRDQGGSFLCLGVVGERRGAVFFLDHEETVGQPLKERFWKIADTFNGFIESLGWRSRVPHP